MTELIYPYDLAPVIPAPTADYSPLRETSGEWFPVVERSGLVVGRALRSYCHSGAKPLHPVIHIHIIDRNSRIYLQKRPLTKDIQPGKWDTAVGGHVSYGESIVEAVYREAYEELRLIEFNPIHIETYICISMMVNMLKKLFTMQVPLTALLSAAKCSRAKLSFMLTE